MQAKCLLETAEINGLSIVHRGDGYQAYTTALCNRINALNMAETEMVT